MRLPEDWRNRVINKDKTWMTDLIDHKVHLRTFRGMYTVVKASKNKLCVTCKRWNGREEWVHNSSFIKVAGGIHSIKDESFIKREDPNKDNLPF